MITHATWGTITTSSARDPTSWANMPAAEGTTVAAPAETMRVSSVRRLIHSPAWVACTLDRSACSTSSNSRSLNAFWNVACTRSRKKRCSACTAMMATETAANTTTLVKRASDIPPAAAFTRSRMTQAE